jgi:DNA adenine methylase
MSDHQARPFLKWAGGKRNLLYRLTELMPPKAVTYFEPFLGAGALYFHLANAGRFKRAVLSDTNEELIRTWVAIKTNHVGVGRELSKHQHNKRHYEKVREKDPARLSDEACAARMIMLNRAGFNGLYRLNRSGMFNVPWGKNAKMEIFIDPAVLKAASVALNERPTTIVCCDFADATRRVRLGDATYADPPFAPVKAGSFVSYTAGGFGDDDQARVAKWFTRLSDAGMRVLLSNSSCDQTDLLYAGHAIQRVMMKRSINSDASKRQAIKEVLVLSRALAEAQIQRQ